MHGHDDEVTKLAKIAALNADLQAGRVFIGVDYGTEPSIATVQYKCARCDAVLEVPSGGKANDWNQAVAAHHERCFRVGDHVRWEYGLGVHGNWVEGTIVRYAPGEDSVDIRIEREGPKRTHQGGVQTFGGTSTLRRIPRPEQKGEARFKPGDRVRWWPNGLDYDRRKSPFVDGVVQDDVRYLKAEYVVGFNSNWVNMQGGGVYDWSVCPGTLRHRDESHAFVRGAACGPCSLGPPEETCAICQRDPRNDVHCFDGAIRFTMNDASAPAANRIRIVGEYLSAGTLKIESHDGEKWRIVEGNPAPHLFVHGDDGPVCPVPADPLDTTYDGQTLRDLLAADLAMSRETLISDMPLWFRLQDGLTRTQRQAVSAYRSAELRAKIDEARETDRRRVCVDLGDGDEPW
jgi:hypothetical protein